MSILNIENKRIAIALVVIVVGFCVLSVPYKDGRSTYAYSELMRDLGVTQRIDSGELIQLGPISSLGDFHFGPAYYYLIYPFVKLMGFKLFSLALTSALFMLFTIIGIFVLAKRWFHSELIGLFASGIMAFSILTFQLTKYGSNPNFIPFFSILFYYSLRELFVNPKNVAYTTILAFSSGILTQLHAVPSIVVPLTLVIALVLTRFRIATLKNVLVFTVINIILYYPYLYYEFSNNFSNIKNVFILEPGGGSEYLQHLAQFYIFFLNPVISLHSYFDVFNIGGPSFVYLLFGLLSLVPAVLYFNLRHLKYLYSRVSKIDLATKKVIVLWILVPAVIYLLPLSSRDFYIYYFFIIFPLAYLFAAYGLDWLFRKGLHLIGIYAIVCFFILQFVQFFMYYNLVSSLK
ncbi:MAG TPA: glycosyltransferase family 39 protein [Candidatus Doudnabacteria bacterium]|nr:glycosyltransferase family 39 protein [Candidatus Doudnabacteria bacterium]